MKPPFFWRELMLVSGCWMTLTRADEPAASDVLANPGAAREWKLPSERVSLKPGSGQAVVTGQCAVCHSLDYLTTQPPLTRTAWQTSVDKMRTRYGAPITTNLAPAVVGYLVQNYGRENPPPKEP